MVVALEDSDTNSSLVAKALDVKEPRFAQADAVEAALGVKPADGKVHFVRLREDLSWPCYMFCLDMFNSG
jgi:hypothetical protein